MKLPLPDFQQTRKHRGNGTCLPEAQRGHILSQSNRLLPFCFQRVRKFSRHPRKQRKAEGPGLPDHENHYPAILISAACCHAGRSPLKQNKRTQKQSWAGKQTQFVRGGAAEEWGKGYLGSSVVCAGTMVIHMEENELDPYLTYPTKKSITEQLSKC